MKNLETGVQMLDFKTSVALLSFFFRSARIFDHNQMKRLAVTINDAGYSNTRKSNVVCKILIVSDNIEQAKTSLLVPTNLSWGASTTTIAVPRRKGRRNAMAQCSCFAVAQGPKSFGGMTGRMHVQLKS